MLRTRPNLDHIAMSLGGLCFAHCLITPALLAVSPMLARGLLGNESVHVWLLWLTIPVSALGLWLGCKDHQDAWVIGLGVLGVSLLVGARGVGESPLETLLTVGGSLTLVSAHWRNFRLCQSDHCEE